MDELVYSSPSYYYFAIVEDLVLRFSWAIKLLLIDGLGLKEYSELIISIFAVLEVVRRFIWNFFRLENEHINNCGKFRAVRDISVAPMDASDQQAIIAMMDNPDPSSLWRKKKPKDLMRMPLLEEESLEGRE